MPPSTDGAVASPAAGAIAATQAAAAASKALKRSAAPESAAAAVAAAALDAASPPAAAKAAKAGKAESKAAAIKAAANKTATAIAAASTAVASKAVPAAPAPVSCPATGAELLPPPSSTVEGEVPGTFCADLWRTVAGPGGVYRAILTHPFLVGLAAGTLDEGSFQYYIIQDALFLREYARVLALVAAKAPHPDWTAFFCQCSQGAYEVESSFHKELLAYFGTSGEVETAAAAHSPNSLLYISWLLSVSHECSFYEGLAAVLPCFVVYLEVGRALKQKGSPHRLYQQWIDKYGGEDFACIVLQAVRLTNEVAVELGPVQKERMRELFLQGCRMEYLFWDGAYCCRKEPPV